jgi:hypothetical protein
MKTTDPKQIARLAAAFGWCARHGVTIQFAAGGVFLTVPGLGRYWGKSFIGLCRSVSERMPAARPNTQRQPSPSGPAS